MSAANIFKFNTSQIRAVDIKGEPWFVATYVCKVLGMANPTMALRPLGHDEKCLSSFETVRGTYQIKQLRTDEKGITETNTLGGNPNSNSGSETAKSDLGLASRVWTVILGTNPGKAILLTTSVTHLLTIRHGHNHNGDRRTTVLYDLTGKPACTTLAGHLNHHAVEASLQWFRNNDINRKGKLA